MKYFFDKMQSTAAVSAASLAVVISVAAPAASAQDARTQALEQQLRQLETSLRAVRNELEQVKAESARDAQRLMQIEQKSTSIEKRQVVEAQKVAKIEETAASTRRILDSSPHMLFFRGGYARSNDLRNGVSIQSGGIGGAGGQADRDAWYIGAGFDFNLTNDVWGLIPSTSLVSELMFEYKEFGTRIAGNALTPPRFRRECESIYPDSIAQDQIFRRFPLQALDHSCGPRDSCNQPALRIHYRINPWRHVRYRRRLPYLEKLLCRRRWPLSPDEWQNRWHQDRRHDRWWLPWNRLLGRSIARHRYQYRLKPAARWIRGC